MRLLGIGFKGLLKFCALVDLPPFLYILKPVSIGNRRETNQYAEEYPKHEKDCTANHKGSAGKMKVDSVIEMFCCSIKNLGVRFLNYIGDGYSKTYSGILRGYSTIFF